MFYRRGWLTPRHENPTGCSFFWSLTLGLSWLDLPGVNPRRHSSQDHHYAHVKSRRWRGRNLELIITYAERANRDDVRVNLPIAKERVLPRYFHLVGDILFQDLIGLFQSNLPIADFSLFIIGGFELVILFYWDLLISWLVARVCLKCLSYSCLQLGRFFL